MTNELHISFAVLAADSPIPLHNIHPANWHWLPKAENGKPQFRYWLIPDRRFLFDGSVNFNHQEETYSSTSRYFSGTEEYFKSVDKRDGYAVHLRANYLSIHRTLSTIDFRRSFYNGIYLKQSELKNQLHWTSYSKNYDPNLKWSLYDAFDFGLTDHINLFLNAEYSRVREKAENDNDKSTWNYSSGLTFYNLNFSGDELNDFDYFYGRIVQPKDYVATISWRQSHRTSFYQSNLKGVRVDLETGLLSNMEVSLYYDNQKNSYKNASGSAHDFGAGLRINLLNQLRFLVNASYGRSHSERRDNSYNIPTSNHYQWNLRLGAQAAF
ncbi:MAG: hypothetical protein ONB31_12710 [candidate division KSB1 bacterium]|nr:hypothetical protein [candidate division KSB1 bacterium]